MASSGQKPGRPRNLIHPVADVDAEDALERIVDRRVKAGDAGAVRLSRDLTLEYADRAVKYVTAKGFHPSVDDLHDAALLDAWLGWQLYLMQRKADDRLVAIADAVTRHPERPAMKDLAENEYGLSKQALAARIDRARAGQLRERDPEKLKALNGTHEEAVRRPANGRAVKTSEDVPVQPVAPAFEAVDASVALKEFQRTVRAILNARYQLTDAVLEEDLDELEELLEASEPVRDASAPEHTELRLHLKFLLASTEADPATGVERPLFDSANPQVRALIDAVRGQLGLHTLVR
jgi:uncharacterized tellurite resistance protein B-like protein